jgi:hypothetical protein
LAAAFAAAFFMGEFCPIAEFPSLEQVLIDN